jgi:hypothetical protein
VKNFSQGIIEAGIHEQERFGVIIEPHASEEPFELGFQVKKSSRSAGCPPIKSDRYRRS